MEIGLLCRAKPGQIQFTVGIIVLAVGVLVYLLDRPSTSVYFVPNSWSFGDSESSVFGAIGNQLPTFAHTFAFILFTSALLRPWQGSTFVACAGWWLIASVFEIAQRDEWAGAIAGRVPDWFADWPLLENVAGYFIGGRFDLIDLLSISLATVCAFMVIQLSGRYG